MMLDRAYDFVVVLFCIEGTKFGSGAFEFVMRPALPLSGIYSTFLVKKGLFEEAKDPST